MFTIKKSKNKEIINISGSFQKYWYMNKLFIKTSLAGRLKVSLVSAEINNIKFNVGTSSISSFKLVEYECNLTSNMKKPHHFFEEFKQFKEVIEYIYIKNKITNIQLSHYMYKARDINFYNFPFITPKIKYLDRESMLTLKYTEDTVIEEKNEKYCSVSYLAWKFDNCDFVPNVTYVQDIFKLFNEDVIEKFTVEGNTTTVIFSNDLFSNYNKIWFYDFPFEMPKILEKPLQYEYDDISWRTLKFIKETGKSIPSENLYRYQNYFKNIRFWINTGNKLGIQMHYSNENYLSYQLDDKYSCTLEIGEYIPIEISFYDFNLNNIYQSNIISDFNVNLTYELVSDG